VTGAGGAQPDGQALTTETFLAAGEAVVGLELTAANTPSGGLSTGDVVGVVFVAAAAQPPYPQPVPPTRATVWSVAANSDGTSVNLQVLTALASKLSADASHNEITLVRLSASDATWPLSGSAG
jgi:hypothetical protein